MKMRNPSIVHVISTTMPPREGIGVYAFGLSKYLDSQGIESVIVCRRASQEAAAPEQREVQTFPVIPPRTFPIHPFQFAKVVRNSLHRMKLSPRTILHVHSPLVSDVRFPGPTVATVHTPVVTEIWHYEWRSAYACLSRLQVPFSWLAEASLLRSAERITAVSDSVAEQVRRTHPRMAQPTVIHNSIDAAEFTPSDDKVSPPMVLFVGRLAPRKGAGDFVRAAEELVRAGVSAAFVMCGNGPYERKVSNYVRTRDLKTYFSLISNLSRRRLSWLYSRATVFVSPSRYEGLPTSLLEAMSSGLGIVATRIPSHAEVLEDRKDALLCRVGSPRSLAERTRTLLEDPALARRLGERARNKILERFSWRSNGPKMIRTYREIFP